MSQLTPEEARALEVAKCAAAAVLDTATLCARAGLIGIAVQEDLATAYEALERLIATINGQN